MNLQYRGEILVSPAPSLRPTHGEVFRDVETLLDLLPTRPEAQTDAMRTIMTYFVHSTAFGTDREGRPVR